MLSPRDVTQAKTKESSNYSTNTSTKTDQDAQNAAKVMESSGNVTKPKILTPSSNGQKTVSFTEGTKSGEKAGSATSPFGREKTSVISDSVSSLDRLYPLKLKVPTPSYMRLTTSCLVKRKLEPNFTNSYTSLNFVEASPRVPALYGMDNASSAQPTQTRKSVNPSSNKTLRNASSGAGSSQGLVDLSLHQLLLKKKLYGVDGAMPKRKDSVPNIRNNSTVFQPHKLTATASKVR
jgi:hypothetical protein